jgi:hypothetical protein
MVTDQQVRRLFRLDTQGLTRRTAADKAGLDPKTARKYRRLERLPSEVAVMDRHWRTRSDAFAEVWPELAERLQLNPGLEAKTLFLDLQRRFPGRFADGQLRALQRRVKAWRASCGPAREVYFDQVHHPGRLCASDFTHCTDLRVTIHGAPFDHLIYHFVLTYSNWEAGTVCFAESYESLAEGLQNALWQLGGVPQVHRTDRLSAAIPPGGAGAFGQRYQALLRHYGLHALRPSGVAEHARAISRASAAPSSTGSRGGSTGFLWASAASSPSVTNRSRMRSTVRCPHPRASATRRSSQPGPSSPWSVCNRMRARVMDRAGRRPDRTSASNCSRSVEVRVTTYRFVGMAGLPPRGLGCGAGGRCRYAVWDGPGTAAR